MHRFINHACLFALLAVVACSAQAKKNGEAARAEELIKQSRAAIGGEEKIASIHGLTLKGNFRRIMQERDISGEREFNFLLPDKFMKSDTIIIPGSSASRSIQRTLNGSQSWSSGGPGGNGGMFIMMGPGGANPTKEEMEKSEQEQTLRFRAEYARYLLALLLTSPSGYDIEFNYAGEAVADDGRADVIDATGPENFAARLFLDKETHLPLMITYRAPKPRMITSMMRGTDDKRKQEEQLREAREKAAQELATAKPELVEMQLRFMDYRKVDGLMLPHKITQSSDGEVNEEWEIKSYEINPQFKADKFQKK
ncbi:MAG TPA: hypothetical protein VF735_04950 [Pyrinomonadaceae bacterium]|jgi:hypothetical protein